MKFHSFSEPHSRRCETCSRNVLKGDCSCPIFTNGHRPWDDEKENDRDLFKKCGEANVITMYIGCSTWKSRKTSDCRMSTSENYE